MFTSHRRFPRGVGVGREMPHESTRELATFTFTSTSTRHVRVRARASCSFTRERLAIDFGVRLPAATALYSDYSALKSLICGALLCARLLENDTNDSRAPAMLGQICLDAGKYNVHTEYKHAARTRTLFMHIPFFCCYIFISKGPRARVSFTRAAACSAAFTICYVACATVCMRSWMVV